jgi:hypothetical protein
MRTNADDPDIAIRLTQGANRDITVPITWVEVSIGKCTLGAHLAPAGSDTTESPTSLSANGPREYSISFHYDDPTEVFLPFGSNMFLWEAMWIHPSQALSYNFV